MVVLIIVVAALAAGPQPPAGATPPNDAFSGATVITTLPHSVSQSTTGATTESGEPQPCAEIGSTVWFRYTPGTGTRLQADTFGSGFDTALAVYTGSSLGDLTLVDCNDDAGGTFQSGVEFDAVAGTTYWFQAGGCCGNPANQGDLLFNLADATAPPNDDFADAAVITTLPSSASQSTESATSETDEPQSCTDGFTVWFRYTPSADLPLKADTFGSDFDTALAVYTGSSLGDLTLVDCNDDAGSTFQSRVEFDAVAGTTYWFQAGGCCGNPGDLVFNLADATPPLVGTIAVESPPGSPVSEIDFGTVAVGGSEQRTIFVHNTGEWPLTVSSAAVSTRSFAAGEYRIVSDTATGESIPPGESRQIVLAFEPASGPTGLPDAVGYSGFLIGQPTRAASYTYYDPGTGQPSLFETYRYFRNVGGSGDAAYTATSSNAGTIRDQASGTTTLIGGDAYWMQTNVGTSGVTSAFPRPQLEVTLPTLFSHTLEFQPLPPSVSAPYLTTIGTVSFNRLADAMLRIQSDDPETLEDSPTGTFVALYGHGEGGEAGVSCNGLPATKVGTSGGDVLVGTSGDDVIVGLGGDDTISGFGGNDVICGGPGADLLLGGPGDDVLLGEDDNDNLRGAAGNDTLLGGAGSDRLLPDDGDDALNGGPGSDLVDYRTGKGPVSVDLAAGTGTYAPLTGTGPFTITLTGVEKANGSFDYDDVLKGDGRRNVLRGYGGADTLYGFGGNDDLIGGLDDDVEWGGDGDDLVKGQGGDDTLYGEAGDDKLVGGSGTDTLDGGSGVNILRQ